MDTSELTEKAQNWKETAEDVKGQAQKWKATVSEKAQQTGRVVQDYVHDNTWWSIAIAAALGCALGIFLSRGRTD
jgi:ElaB/YqjD/DUF883 family membrane-anchored ribosome-binding protein